MENPTKAVGQFQTAGRVSFVPPLTALLILFALFAIQTFGTARIGRFFGPIMLLWFATIAVLGFLGLVQRPEVLAAIDPRHG